MNLKIRPAALAMLLCWLASPTFADAVVVIGHAQLPKLDTVTIQRLYTGKVVEIDGTAVTVVNAPSSGALRSRFLQMFLNQDDEKYIAYWTVRKFIGKGLPPREMTPTADVISYVQSTPGAIGYIDSIDLKPGINVLNRK